MRWSVVGLVLFIVLLAQTPAAALWHDWWFATGRAPSAARLAGSLLGVAALTGVQAAFMRPLLGGRWSAAVFVSAAGIALNLLIGSYVFAAVFRTPEAKGAVQLVVLVIMNLIILDALVAWGAQAFFGQKVSVARATRALIIPAMLPALLAVLY